MSSVFDVANHLIWLASQEEEPEGLTPLRLHKLLYFVQGWYAGTFGIPLFPEPIEAWQHGPVVRALYAKLHDHEDRQISSTDLGSVHQLSARDRAFTQAVWEKYRNLSASGLRTLTHEQDPWCAAREGLKATEPSRNPITIESLQRYFGPQVDDASKELPPPARVYEALEHFERGQTLTFDEVFG